MITNKRPPSAVVASRNMKKKQMKTEPSKQSFFNQF
jgi:hypothetical protein